MVSEIGFGSWGVGGKQWGYYDEKESINALKKGIDLGINFIDTGLIYGNGQSERLISMILKEHPSVRQLFNRYWT